MRFLVLAVLRRARAAPRREALSEEPDGLAMRLDDELAQVD